MKGNWEVICSSLSLSRNNNRKKRKLSYKTMTKITKKKRISLIDYDLITYSAKYLKTVNLEHWKL